MDVSSTKFWFSYVVKNADFPVSNDDFRCETVQKMQAKVIAMYVGRTADPCKVDSLIYIQNHTAAHLTCQD